jgi:hypothetical protein
LILVARLTLSAWLTTSRIWHGAVAAIVLAALLTQVVLVLSGGTDVNAVDPQVSIDVGERLVRLFSYFTIQSNILVLIAATSLAANPIRDGRLWRVVRLDALLGIGMFPRSWRYRQEGISDTTGPKAQVTELSLIAGHTGSRLGKTRTAAQFSSR